MVFLRDKVLLHPWFDFWPFKTSDCCLWSLVVNVHISSIETAFDEPSNCGPSYCNLITLSSSRSLIWRKDQWCYGTSFSIKILFGFTRSAFCNVKCSLGFTFALFGGWKTCLCSIDQNKGRWRWNVFLEMQINSCASYNVAADMVEESSLILILLPIIIEFSYFKLVLFVLSLVSYAGCSHQTTSIS